MVSATTELNKQMDLRTDKVARGSLPPQSRKDYVEAVKCLSSKPALSALSDVPGARSRFDDFQATHIIQAPSVHYTVRPSDPRYLWPHTFEWAG